MESAKDKQTMIVDNKNNFISVGHILYREHQVNFLFRSNKEGQS
jgi:hypothetical protein